MSDLVERLRRSGMPIDPDIDPDAVADELERQAATIATLKERLEFDPEHGWDGIACRDVTIKGQDEIIATLREALKNHAEESAKLQSQLDAMHTLIEIQDRREEVLRLVGEPVGKIIECHRDDSCYGKNGADVPEADVDAARLPVGTRLYTESQLLAAYAKGAEDMRERAAGVCHDLTKGGFSTEEEMECVARTLGVANTAIRALPITPNTEGEQSERN